MSDYLNGKLDAVRNPDGIWVNTSVFREEGQHFEKYGYYCPDPWGSPAWYDYWAEQRRRWINGYSVGGVKITGDHYYYLNFCRFLAAESSGVKGVGSKRVRFPDFWDGDYNYFWVREIARYGAFCLIDDEEEKYEVLHAEAELQAQMLAKYFESLHLEVKIEPNHLKGGYNLIVGKSRRKGYSLKSAAIASKAFFTKPQKLIIFGAYDKKYLYPKGIFTMATDNINFINDNTGLAMPSDVVNKQDQIRASYIEYKRGIKLEKGFKSQIMALTFKDNPDAARGKDAEEIFFEESGAFGVPGLLKESYFASEDCVKAGNLKTGMITIFGTSGDMEGGTADYADMHSRPEAFGLLPFSNIWDEGLHETKCGFFHPVHWNLEEFYDEQGNSDYAAAKQAVTLERETLLKSGLTSAELQRKKQEKPFGPGEAFASVSTNTFPVAELKRQKQIVVAKGWQESKGTPVQLRREKGKVLASPILDGTANPITSYTKIPESKRGCVMIYEHPVSDIPPGLYKIGYDPIRQDEGTSLAGLVVYKGVHRNSLHHSIIVAEYIGRMDSADEIDRIAELLADFYNTKIMYENEVTGVKNYFRRIKRLNLLAAQPDAVISKNIKKSRVARVYGCHMNLQLKDAGERYVNDWLRTVIDYDENGDPIRTIDKIYSVRLLEELISYHRKGNFDLVSALFMCMFQVQEEVLGKEYEDGQQTKNVKALLSMMDDMYVKKNSSRNINKIRL